MTRINAILRWFLSTATLAAVAFLAAGRTHLPMVRAYIATFAAITLLAALMVAPGLFEERSNPGDIGLDPFSSTGISILFLSTVAVAAMDAGRFHWTHDITYLTAGNSAGIRGTLHEPPGLGHGR